MTLHPVTNFCKMVRELYSLKPVPAHTNAFKTINVWHSLNLFTAIDKSADQEDNAPDSPIEVPISAHDLTLAELSKKINCITLTPLFQHEVLKFYLCTAETASASDMPSASSLGQPCAGSSNLESNDMCDRSLL